MTTATPTRTQQEGTDRNARLAYAALCPVCDDHMFVCYDPTEGCNAKRYVLRCDHYPDCRGSLPLDYNSKRAGKNRHPIARAAVHTGIERIARLSLRMYRIAGYSADAKRVYAIARSRTYRWLAAQLGIHAKRCHSRFMDTSTCKRASLLLQHVTPQQIRAWAKRQRETAA